MVIGCAGTGVVFAFASRFESGATLSGLNPGGGGPGFLVLLAAAILSLALRRNVELLRPLPATVNAAVVAAFAALASGALLEVVPLANNIDTEPLVSGIAGATFVPRVVAAVLSDAWSRSDETTAAVARRDSDIGTSAATKI